MRFSDTIANKDSNKLFMTIPITLSYVCRSILRQSPAAAVKRNRQESWNNTQQNFLPDCPFIFVFLSTFNFRILTAKSQTLKFRNLVFLEYLPNKGLAFSLIAYRLFLLLVISLFQVLP